MNFEWHRIKVDKHCSESSHSIQSHGKQWCLPVCKLLRMTLRWAGQICDLKEFRRRLKGKVVTSSDRAGHHTFLGHKSPGFFTVLMFILKTQFLICLFLVLFVLCKEALPNQTIENLPSYFFLNSFILLGCCGMLKMCYILGCCGILV